MTEAGVEARIRQGQRVEWGSSRGVRSGDSSGSPQGRLGDIGRRLLEIIPEQENIE